MPKENTREPRGESRDKTTTAKSRYEWAAHIRGLYKQTLVGAAEGFFATGDALSAAKDALDHGEWLAMVKAELPFGPRLAQMLMKIASNKNLRNANSRSYLPASRHVLLELARLSDEDFEEAMAQAKSSGKTLRVPVTEWTEQIRSVGYTQDLPPHDLPPHEEEATRAHPFNRASGRGHSQEEAPQEPTRLRCRREEVTTWSDHVSTMDGIEEREAEASLANEIDRIEGSIERMRAHEPALERRRPGFSTRLDLLQQSLDKLADDDVPPVESIAMHMIERMLQVVKLERLGEAIMAHDAREPGYAARLAAWLKARLDGEREEEEARANHGAA